MDNRAMNGKLQSAEMINRLIGMMEKAGDAIHAAKMRQLYDKMGRNRLVIAFCGHFSAGKSTLINRLCGNDLLPSSPIPTSANVVMIYDGEPGAVVAHRGGHDNTGAAVRREVPLARLAEYCKDGENIETVEIRYPLDWLGKQAVLVDTPGIDSTDDAHRMSTESALHLADAVFYVMDYNHVQSETNFAFTKQLSEWGKPFYLIVNQIDKHNEAELPFDAYRQSVGEAFGNWNIKPDGILFISLKNMMHPHNEWEKLRWLIKRLVSLRESLSAYSVRQSCVRLAESHADFAARRHDAHKSRLSAAIGEKNLDAGKEEAKRERLEQEIAKLRRAGEQLRDRLRREIAAVIENAMIMPAATRDLAHHYLQSRKPGFKVGWIGRAKQTAREIAAREKAFCDDVSEKVKVHLEWHVKQELKKALEAIPLPVDSWSDRIEQCTVEITPRLLADKVQESAGFTDEYTMTYCRRLAADIREEYRRKSFEIIEELAAAYAGQAAGEAEQAEKELALLNERMRDYRELKKMEEAEREYRRQLAALVEANGNPDRPELPDLQRYTPDEADRTANGKRQELARERHHSPDQAAGYDRAAEGDECRGHGRAAVSSASGLSAGVVPDKTRNAGGMPVSDRGHQDRLRNTADRLNLAARCLSGIPAMKGAVGAIREKEMRFRNRSFTISLFGAFSAGKSSFANALMGERILPVSPNPTTAAINRIVPPREGWEHGSARVVFKTPEQIEEDVKHSLQVLGIKSDSMASSLQFIETLEPSRISGRAKPHYAFLRAVKEGWDEAKHRLGSELKVGPEQFSQYAAEERKACFVEFIELFSRNPLTEQGVILVDTPGADSINARHTGVAFNYMKNADAILFVTYYNHAFSHADRELLLQLGRVKDSFELDKMFFIVNAADLAANEEELQAVVGHVEKNLLEHGIRHPRIYPVSSQMAAAAKQNRDPERLRQSGIEKFERDFLRFILDELTELAERSARFELERSAAILEEWIAGMRESEARRLERIAELDRALSEALKMFEDHPDTSADEQEIVREIGELLYYVKQRNGFRFGELFNLAFNPASVRDDGNTRQMMLAAWNELVRFVTFDLSQEVLATTLRVENFMQRLLEKRFRSWNGKIAALLPSYRSGQWTAPAFETPELRDIPQEETAMDPRWLSGHYKNGKQFFEGEGKRNLRDSLEPVVSRMASGYVEGQSQILTEAYLSQYRAQANSLAQKLQESVLEHAQGLREALEMKADMAQLEQALDHLQRIISGPRASDRPALDPIPEQV